uniref:Corticotropin-releasing factor domain-containing protein n=1 Tax=Hippocampus comes TaxID=109280 RepID=A0A3Q2YB80_HIPCM
MTKRMLIKHTLALLEITRTLLMFDCRKMASADIHRRTLDLFHMRPLGGGNTHYKVTVNQPRRRSSFFQDWRDIIYLKEIGNDEEPVKFKTRREYAPLSIDLTFHLLRNMIHNARTEEQRLRAQVNQKLLDEVGK